MTRSRITYQKRLRQIRDEYRQMSQDFRDDVLVHHLQEVEQRFDDRPDFAERVTRLARDLQVRRKDLAGENEEGELAEQDSGDLVVETVVTTWDNVARTLP